MAYLSGLDEAGLLDRYSPFTQAPSGMREWLAEEAAP